MPPRIAPIIAILFVVLCTWFISAAYKKTHTNTTLRAHRAHLLHVQHHLLDPTRWLKLLRSYGIKKLENLEASSALRPQLERIVERTINESLHAVLGDALPNTYLPEIVTRLSQLTQGLSTKLLSSSRVDELQKLMSKTYRHRIRPSVENISAKLGPIIADQIILWLNRKSTKNTLIGVFDTSLASLTHDLKTAAPKTYLTNLQKRYDCTLEYTHESLSQCAAQIQLALDRNASELNTYLLLVYLCGFITLVIVLTNWVQDRIIPYIAFALTTLFWLGGISIPMLTLEGAVESLVIHLGAEQLSFGKNVLFYQSKSILGFVWSMMASREIEIVLVGILITAFSVLFPFLKLTACGYAHLRGYERSTHWLIRFFVEHAGKWSMADIFVVAIFMAYMGLSRLVETQVAQLNASSQIIQALPGTGTTLEAGFYLFLTFCLLGIIVSQKMSQAASNTQV